jgi:hypothetical protein
MSDTAPRCPEYSGKSAEFARTVAAAPPAGVSGWLNTRAVNLGYSEIFDFFLHRHLGGLRKLPIVNSIANRGVALAVDLETVHLETGALHVPDFPFPS